MQSIPRPAQLYVTAIVAAGAVCSAFALSYAGPQGPARPIELLLFLAMAILAGSRKVQLIRGTKYDQVGSMSLGFAITFAALLRTGPVLAMVVGALSCLFGCLYPRRQPAYQLLFNVALTSSTAFLSGLLFIAINRSITARYGLGPLDLTLKTAFPGAAAASLAYFALNTGGVAAVIAFCSGENALRIWRKTFLWTAPSYFAGASISTLALILFGTHLETVLIFGAPIAYLTYQSYAVYMDREEKKQRHIEELQLSKAQLADLYLATIKSLALAIDAKDQYTHQHILRVQRYALATAEEMGLRGSELEGLRTGALLHDIGKLGVPEYVLLKPGRLTEDEYEKIKKHPEIGAAILDPVEFPWPVLPVVKYHHERWDGRGYPEGLAGEDIPLTARILAVADVYDALTSNRSYRNAMSHQEALRTIEEGSASHFDPDVVTAFMMIVDRVVSELAREGQGPKAVNVDAVKVKSSKADQAALDIHRASCELSALYEVAQTISCSLGLEETLDILARKLQAIVPGAACLFLLSDKESDTLRVRAAVGVNREFFLEGATLNDSSATVRVARDKKTYHGPYDSDDLILTGSPMSQWTPLESTLIVPILHEGEVLGTINLYHPDRAAFGPYDIQLMETIADRIAIALYNGLLFDRTRSHAFTDPLTGLYNLRYLAQYVEERFRLDTRRPSIPAEGPPEGYAVVSTRAGGRDRREPAKAGQFALLCLDLDSFKPINDNFGHQKGDEVLRSLSQLFRSMVRDHDLVARYGGDEFLVVLQGVDGDDARDMASRLLAAVEKFDPGLDHPKLGSLHLGVSIGVACCPEDGQDWATLLSTADSRMHAIKTERKLGQLAGFFPGRDPARDSDDSNSAGARLLYIKEVSA
jgi:diguanylate cyclase (GGDEF)-like protein/putative nucleotidyltransferase with HDIG domain